ncbi:hypothetical protein [Siccirubricoccus phaeus]|uniref:hypothetical protein n=1 Tax=Siccirubricoccus phaeus TaxID=2595053 RepID=UPI00165A6DEF|nr:hypothetical protein [Siccirubricoccus phaeus]
MQARTVTGGGVAGRAMAGIAAGLLALLATLAAARAQPQADGPKPSDLQMPAPRPLGPAPRRPAAAPQAASPQATPRPPLAPATTAGEDPAAAAAGDAMLPPALRDIRDAQPPNPELIARQAGLRLRRGQPVDLRGTGRPPSAAEFGELLAPR